MNKGDIIGCVLTILGLIGFGLLFAWPTPMQLPQVGQCYAVGDELYKIVQVDQISFVRQHCGDEWRKYVESNDRFGQYNVVGCFNLCEDK